MQGQALKVLHIADCHLGRRGRDGHILAQLRRVVEVCLEEGVKALLIAGDLFDTPNPPAELRKGLLEVLAPLSEGGVKVVAICGNHDRGVGPLGGGITFLEEPEEMRLGDCLLYLFPYDPKGSFREVLEAIPSRREAPCQILVCHASYCSWGDPRIWSQLSEQEALFWPFTPKDIEGLPIDYVALGHYHNPILWQEGGVLCGYPGTIEPLSFQEEGGRKAFLILWDGRLRVREVDLGAQCPHRTLRWRIGVDVREEEVPDRIRALEGEGGAFRVILGGIARDLTGLKVRVGRPQRVRVEWEVLDLREISGDPLLSAFLQVMRERGQEGLIPLGLSLLQGHVD